jgi:hypothetical protein
VSPEILGEQCLARGKLPRRAAKRAPLRRWRAWFWLCTRGSIVPATLRRPLVPARAVLVAAAVNGCAPSLVPLDAAPAGGVSPPPFLEVIATNAGGTDPLPVTDTVIRFGGLAIAAGRFASSAAGPWAQLHAAARPGGWQLLLEIVRSNADVADGHLTVEIETRITLRATLGQVHLGQTRGYCKVSEPVSSDGAPVVYQCLARLGRDLAGWLDGISP